MPPKRSIPPAADQESTVDEATAEPDLKAILADQADKFNQMMQSNNALQADKFNQMMQSNNASILASLQESLNGIRANQDKFNSVLEKQAVTTEDLRKNWSDQHKLIEELQSQSSSLTTAVLAVNSRSAAAVISRSAAPKTPLGAPNTPLVQGPSRKASVQFAAKANHAKGILASPKDPPRPDTPEPPGDDGAPDEEAGSVPFPDTEEDDDEPNTLALGDEEEEDVWRDKKKVIPRQVLATQHDKVQQLTSVTHVSALMRFTQQVNETNILNNHEVVIRLQGKIAAPIIPTLLSPMGALYPEATFNGLQQHQVLNALWRANRPTTLQEYSDKYRQALMDYMTTPAMAGFKQLDCASTNSEAIIKQIQSYVVYAVSVVDAIEKYWKISRTDVKNLMPPVYKSAQAVGTDRVLSLVNVFLMHSPYKTIEYFHNSELIQWRDTKGPDTMRLYLEAMAVCLRTWIKKASQMNPFLSHLQLNRNMQETYGHSKQPLRLPGGVPGLRNRGSAVDGYKKKVIAQMEEADDEEHQHNPAELLLPLEPQYAEDEYEEYSHPARNVAVNVVEPYQSSRSSPGTANGQQQSFVNPPTGYHYAPPPPVYAVEAYKPPQRPVGRPSNNRDPQGSACNTMILNRMCGNNNCAYSHDPAIIAAAREKIAQNALLDKQGAPIPHKNPPPPYGSSTRHINAMSSNRILAISNGETFPNALNPVMQMREVLDYDDQHGSDFRQEF
jgi:hypothetical protein